MENNFKNPWAEGGELYPEKVLETSYSTFDAVTSSEVNNETLSTVAERCEKSLGTTELKNVKSLTLAKEILNAGSTWSLVRKKFKDRDKLLDQLLAMGGLPQTEVDTLTLLKTGKSGVLTGLWNYMRNNVYNDNFNFEIYIDNDFLDYHRNYDAAIEAELTALSELENIRYKNLKSSITGHQQFHYYYKAFVRQIIKIKEEKTTEKDRFDAFFNGSMVKKALSKFKDIQFYPSELKAQVFQESGDIANTSIAGIIDNIKGLKKKGNVNASFVGIAQIGLDALKEGKSWATKNDITFKDADPRKEPESAIILLACILASNYELYLSKAMKYDGTNCLNWKKCLFASYNRSGPLMMNLIKKYKSIEWSVLAADSTMPMETRNYIIGIMNRL